MLRKTVALLVAVAVLAIPAAAQQATPAPPDYVISNIRTPLSADGSEVTITFEVGNIGGPADQNATVNVLHADSGRIIGEDVVPPLQMGESAQVTFRFPAGTDDFPAGSVQSIRIEVGVDEIEPLNGPTIKNNIVTISVNVPQTAGGRPAGQQGQPVAGGSEGAPFSLPIDLSDPGQVILALGAGLIILILLWLLSVILRLIFSRPPTFGTWQPPYANLPMLDPNSVAGRRQLWQQHAQNGSILQPCAEGAGMVAIKLLQGFDGVNLSGWHIVAMRMGHYDMYGRVSRSQILAAKGLVKKLDKIAHRSGQYDEDGLQRRLRPVAKGLVKQFKKKLDKRNAMLPISLDIQFEGKHGEVKIVFELYRCENWTWQRVDQWEPEMRVIDPRIHETYTYTAHGQAGGETIKAYRSRLEEDILWLMTEMVKRHPVDMVPPDTLSGMTPITDQEAAAQ